MAAALIRVERVERAAGADDVRAAIAAIAAGPGAWLGCDVTVPGMFRREARAALAPLLAFYLDGRRLVVVPHGDLGRALAQVLPRLAAFEAVQGRLEAVFAPQPEGPHPALALLRRFLAMFTPAPADFGLYGALAFDYWRLAHGDAIPDDGRRRVALILPQRVLLSGEQGERWVDFQFPGLAPVAGEPALLDAVQPERRDDDLPPGGHAQVVARGVEHMRRGELRSLVLSQTFRRPAQVDVAAAFARLRRDNPYPAMFLLNLGGGEQVFGASPDIQVRADRDWVQTTPVCGTFRRGADAVDDYAQAKALLNSAVDEAALAVCADSDCNDKALVCEPGTVELVAHRRIHFFTTIIHGISHTRGRRRAGVDGFDIVLAHATPATVTGMPKASARAVIDALEPTPRGWYAGAAVHIGADGQCEALTILRCARLAGGMAEVRTGGNLLADSEPAREEEETRLKAEAMFRVLAGQSPAAPAAAAMPPAPVRVAFDPLDDALAALAREALVQAGAQIDAAAPIRVVGDGSPQRVRAALDAAGAAPLLALNTAALALLAGDGAPLRALQPPQFARTLACSAVAGGPLAALGEFSAGIYAAHTIAADALPAGWTLAACGADGRAVAALHAQRRAVALLYRPDVALSSPHRAGRRVLMAALAWLAAARP